MQYLQPQWPAPANICAYTTTRHSFGHIKRALPTDEAAANIQLTQLLHLPSSPIWLKQVHGATAIEAIPANLNQAADASFTAIPNRVCIVETADCLPLLICNLQGTHIAAIHAGWRGLAAGIIKSTLSAMQHPPEDLLVWLGPAIGPQRFEVGQDVYEAFIRPYPEASHAFLPYTENKWFANLYALAKLQLYTLGVKHIYGGNFCTYTQDDLFFSFRRDKGHTGRMASLIWIK